MRIGKILRLGIIAAGAVHLYKKHVSLQRVDPTLRHPKLYLVFSAREKLTLWAMRNLDRKIVLPSSAVEHSVHPLPSANGSVHLYIPTGLPPAAPVFIWIHGGGLIAGSAEFDHQTASFYAENIPAAVASVEYRLAPEHPYPAAIDDCYEALLWVIDNAAELGIDANRIAIGGMSAGGGLAAALAQRAVDSGIALRAQLLIYPMLDDASAVLADSQSRGISWTKQSNYFGWKAYLNREPGMVDDQLYAVPANRKDLKNLPPAWIGVGELDLFFEEDRTYSQRLLQAEVPVEFVQVEGMYHAAEMIMPKAEKSQQFLNAQLEFLRTQLNSEPIRYP